MRATTPSSMAANPPRTYGISRLLLYDELHALHPQDTHGGVRLYDLPVGAARRPGLTVYIDGKTWTAPEGSALSMRSVTRPTLFSTRSALVGLISFFISLTTSGRVKASAAMDTAKNSPTCSHQARRIPRRSIRPRRPGRTRWMSTRRWRPPPRRK